MDKDTRINIFSGLPDTNRTDTQRWRWLAAQFPTHHLTSQHTEQGVEIVVDGVPLFAPLWVSYEAGEYPVGSGLLRDNEVLAMLYETVWVTLRARVLHQQDAYYTIHAARKKAWEEFFAQRQGSTVKHETELPDTNTPAQVHTREECHAVCLSCAWKGGGRGTMGIEMVEEDVQYHVQQTKHTVKLTQAITYWGTTR